MTSRTGPEPASPASESVVRNPYRVLGLSGDGAWAEIRAAADRILGSPEPERHATAWDLPWLGEVPRSPAEVERAIARLGDPRVRLRSRIFWFHERVAESAVHELQPSTIRNALEGWSATSLEIARHDAAVVALIAAIHLDPTVENSALWQRALREWDEALDLEAYWMDVLRVEMEGGFESPASLAEVRDLRDLASELVTEPLLVYAREAVIAGQNPRAARTLAVLREVLPKDAFTARCGDLAEHVWGSFDADWTPRPVPRPEEPPPKPADAPAALPFQTQNPGMWDFAAEIEDSDATPPPARKPERERPTTGPIAEKPAGPGTAPTSPRPDEATPRRAGAAPRPDEAPPPEPPPVRKREAPSPRLRSTDDRAAAPPADAAADPRPAPSAAPPPPETAPEADEPDLAPRDAPGRPAPARRRPRRPVRPAVVAAAVAAVILATVLFPRLRPETEVGAAPADRVVRVEIEGRMDTIDEALAEAMLDRREASLEIEAIQESVDGYQTLVDDYERRMTRRLPADRAAYRRVIGLHDEARRDLDRALGKRAAIEARIERLEDLSRGLMEEWNAVSVPAGAATDREPSP